MLDDEVKYKFALLDGSDNPVRINNIDREFCINHSFHCPNCKREMYATFGPKIRPHFRHNGDKCAYNDYLHASAEATFKKEYQLCIDENKPFFLDMLVPARCNKVCTLLEKNIECKELNNSIKTVNLVEQFKRISIETRVRLDNHTRRPDILLESEDGRQIWVEIWVTHPTDEEKQKDGHIIELKINNEDDLAMIDQHRLVKSEGEDSKVRLFNMAEVYPDLYANDEFSCPLNSYAIEETSSVRPQEEFWVDLGLPSGTLWAKSDVTENGKPVRMNFYDAQKKFNGKLPSKEQARELIDNCVWSYDRNSNQLIGKGQNGNSIAFVLISHFNKRYWLNRLESNEYEAQSLHLFSTGIHYLNVDKTSNELYIRRVKGL